MPEKLRVVLAESIGPWHRGDHKVRLGHFHDAAGALLGRRRIADKFQFHAPNPPFTTLGAQPPRQQPLAVCALKSRKSQPEVKARGNQRSTSTRRTTQGVDSGSRRQWRKETWRRIKCLGEGATGQVWLEECSEDEKHGQLQAVKTMPKRGRTDYYQELEAIAKFSQSTSKYEGLFVKSLGWYETERSVFIVMEHMKYGSLASHLHRPLPEKEVKHITYQVLEGLASLHESGFVHRDLKPDNILVASKGPRWWVKTGDFGFSKRITEGSCLQTIVGTQNYFAPEILGLNYRTMDSRT
ncbi:kinase-like domain-containing protein [Aspergillus germanicus]